MSKLSKTTYKFAAARQLKVIYEEKLIREMDLVAVWPIAGPVEPPLCVYIANEGGAFTFWQAASLSAEVREELPATLRDEKHLREVINFIKK